ncbi:hypothetical protein FQN54_001587 [Arachnomyces sp. PD_36]|nr:hypothetical protein FQN54_001587 [Arachnomyces sp. PD_36]
MAFVIAGSVPWHDGEEKMHRLMRVPENDNPSAPNLSQGAAYLTQSSPLLALGTLDEDGRPWTTIWGGKPGFAGQFSQSTLGIRSMVDTTYDPVVQALLGGKADGEVVGAEGEGKMVSGLAVDLENRRRVKLYGRMVAGALEGLGSNGTFGQAQLAVNIEQSLGNCPKYLNRKTIVPAELEPNLVSESPQLPQGAIDLLNNADTLFLSSSHQNLDMDTNIRGGPRGFIRILSNDPSGTVLVYPEYSGNRLYQTLGNLQTTPKVGFAFPDFESGNVLYVTGETEVLVGEDAASLLPRSNLAVKVTVKCARYVEKGLPFRGEAGDPSPYNPAVRYLVTEKAAAASQGSGQTSTSITLVKKVPLTPSINRFRFRVSDPKSVGKWIPGQYATLSFEDELDMGYSHMRDDDPTSINDDYIRTFTVSSSPGLNLPDNEFEITARKSGRVTSHLFRSNERAGIEAQLRGFGGDFKLDKKGSGGPISFVAGGIGITPVIPQLPGIDIPNLRLFWSLSVQDIGLAFDTFKQFSELPRSTVLFLTGSESNLPAKDLEKLETVVESGARIERRRLEAADLDLPDVEEWYLCAGTALKTAVLNWLVGKKVIYEDFTY